MPTFFKVISNVHLKDVWQNAAIELQQATRFIIVGYSLPQADYHIRNLFIKNIGDNTEEIVIVLRDEDELRRKGLSTEEIEEYKKTREDGYVRFFGDKSRVKPTFKFTGTKKFLTKETKLLLE